MNKNVININDEAFEKLIEETVKKIIESRNYAVDFNSEEFNDYTKLAKKDTGLPYDIYVDCEFAYKRYNHSLCLYVDIDGKPIPVKLSYNPVPIGGRVPNFDVLKTFIRKNYVTLIYYANFKISGGEFFRRLDKNLNDETINELTSYSPQDTNLPVWVWIDDNQSYKRSGHNQSYRMKFQQDPDIHETRLWMPLLLPSLEIHESDTIPRCKIQQRKINKVIQWAKLNMEALLLLKDAKITGDDFTTKYLKKLPNVHIKRDHVDNVPSYKVTSDTRFGYTIVKTDDNKFTAVTDDGQTFFLNQAAVTFFKGRPGDELYILTNEKDNGGFAAIEAVIKK